MSKDHRPTRSSNHLTNANRGRPNHLADGSFKPEIARTFPFDQTVEAYKYLESNEQIGKVVIILDGA